MLTDQLTLILIKHSTKFKIEILFLIALVTAYAGPVGASIAMRKKVQAAKNQLPPPNRNSSQPNQNKAQVIIVDEKIPVSEEGNPTIKIRKRRGGQSKG